MWLARSKYSTWSRRQSIISLLLSIRVQLIIIISDVLLPGEIDDLKLTSDCVLIYAMFRDGTMRVYSVPDKSEVTSLRCEGLMGRTFSYLWLATHSCLVPRTVTDVTIDNKYVIQGTETGIILVYDIANKKEAWRLSLASKGSIFLRFYIILMKPESVQLLAQMIASVFWWRQKMDVCIYLMLMSSV